MQMSKAGVYMILNVGTNARYVGLTHDSFSRRWSRHRSGLMRGRHECAALQEAWNSDGPDAFAFVILEVLPKRPKQPSRERFWCDLFRSQGIPLYNLHMNGYSHRPETRRKLSAAKKGKPHPRAAEIFAKDWPPITAPDGTVHSGVHNLLAFCVSQGLGAAAISPMRKVALGMVRSYKGWTAPEARAAYLAEHPFRRPDPVPLTCEFCGAEFTAKRSHAEQRRFCSLACRNKHDSVAYSGAGNPNYRHGRRIGA